MHNNRHPVPLIVLLVMAAVCMHPVGLSAQTAACETETSVHAAQALQGWRDLAARTDPSGVQLRTSYGIPTDLTVAEVTVITDPIVCGRAAAFYFTDRDSTHSTAQTVFVLRLRNVYYVEEPRLRADGVNAPKPIRGIVTDTAFTTVRARFQSR